jgi:SRSO17 transposase
MEIRECSCGSEFQVAEESEELVQQALTQLRPHFRRQEAHQHAADYLRGLIAHVERKNGWQLAEYAGYGHPRGMQRVLDRYTWDDGAVREDLRRYVVTELGDPAGVLVVDETGFVKQGKHSVGVARQYCGTLGKIANCQIGVFPSASSGQVWATLVPGGTAELMAPSLCPRGGSRTRNGVRRWESLQRGSTAPSPSWLWRCWSQP